MPNPWEMEWQTAPPTDQHKPWEMEWQGSSSAVPTTAGTGRTGTRLKGTPTGGSPLLPMATATMIGGPILGEAAGLIPLGKAAMPEAPQGGLPPLGTTARVLSHLVPGGGVARSAYNALRELIPAVDRPTMPAPPVTFPTRPTPMTAPPVTFPAPESAPVYPAPPVRFNPVGEEAPPPTRTYPAPPVRFKTTGKGTAPTTAPAPGQSIPETTLPSRDWRFEDARDMARLLHQHGIDPADMEDEQWGIAAPALKRNLGVPNDNAKNMVTQEWNKLQGAQ